MGYERRFLSWKREGIGGKILFFVVKCAPAMPYDLRKQYIFVETLLDDKKSTCSDHYCLSFFL